MGELLSATHIEVDANVRYWEDGEVDGVVDDDGSRIPGRQGDSWKVRIDLADGQVVGWPAGVAARIHYKVCDEGLYWLTDAEGNRLARWPGHYVPCAFLCQGEQGFGDYIILDISGEGRASPWTPPAVDPKGWVLLTDTGHERGVV